MAEKKSNTGKIVAIIIAVCAGIGVILAAVLLVPGMIVKSEIDSATQKANDSYEESRSKAMLDYEDAKNKAMSDYEDAKNKKQASY